MTGAAIYPTRNLRTAYSGAWIRVRRASDNAEQDIGFNTDGSPDMTAYAAFGTGSEKVVTRYDISGNGHHLTQTDLAKCPVIRTSTYNNKPCFYYPGTAVHKNTAFNDWNGKTEINLFFLNRQISAQNGYMWAGGGGGKYSYCAFGVPDRYTRFATTGGSYNDFTLQFSKAGALFRYQFDGAAGTNAARARLYRYTEEQTNPIVSGTHPATLGAETGLYIGGDVNGNYLDFEDFGVYYLGNSLTDAEVRAIQNDTRAN